MCVWRKGGCFFHVDNVGFDKCHPIVIEYVLRYISFLLSLASVNRYVVAHEI